MQTIRSICVYCGSSTGKAPSYADAATILGKDIAAHDLRLVFGGGTHGIMGAVSAAAIEAGGKVTGIIPTFLLQKEAAEGEPQGMDEVIIVDTMHERKTLMFERSDAFVALPGGIGTVEEIIEMMTWAQLGRHQKPMIFGNIDGFWEPMRDLINHMSEEGFLHSTQNMKPQFIDKAEDIVAAILAAAKA